MITAVEGAEAVLKKPKATDGELRGSLRNLVGAHRDLERNYSTALSERDRAYVLLSEDYSLGGEEKDEVRRADRRAVITELIGEGYDSTSERKFQRHKALAFAAIKQIAGRGNTLRQQELAEAVLSHYVCNEEAAVEPGSVDYVAHAAVISGLVGTLDTLRKRNNGRYTTADRITQEVLLNSAMSGAKGRVLSAISRLLHQGRGPLSKAAARVDTERGPYKDGLLNPDRAFFIREEKSSNAYKEEWSEFVEESWDELTRASECAKDEVRDPVAHSSGAHATHRIHWINNRLDDLTDIMNVLGKDLWEDFSLSKPTMLLKKKYYHRYPGRNTCLCR